MHVCAMHNFYISLATGDKMEAAQRKATFGSIRGSTRDRGNERRMRCLEIQNLTFAARKHFICASALRKCETPAHDVVAP